MKMSRSHGGQKKKNTDETKEEKAQKNYVANRSDENYDKCIVDGTKVKDLVLKIQRRALREF